MYVLQGGISPLIPNQPSPYQGLAIHHGWLGFYMVCFALPIKQNHSRNMHRNHNFSRATEITFQVSRRMRKNVSLFIKINKFPTYLNARIKHEIGRKGSLAGFLWNMWILDSIQWIPASMLWISDSKISNFAGFLIPLHRAIFRYAHVKKNYSLPDISLF